MVGAIVMHWNTDSRLRMSVYVGMSFRTQRRGRVGRYPLFGGDSYFLIGGRRILRLSDRVDIPSSRVLLPNVDPVFFFVIFLLLSIHSASSKLHLRSIAECLACPQTSLRWF